MLSYCTFSYITTEVSHSGNKASLAYSTARTRWPKIFIAAIADVEATLCTNVQDSAEIEDGEDVIKDLKNILSDLRRNAKLVPIPDDGASGIEAFNAELEYLGPITWHNAPWLYCECYMYRLMHTCFSMRRTPFWKTYDVFAKQKSGALKSSKSVIVELVQWFLKINEKTHEHEVKDEKTLKALLEEMIQVSLWGNATDLLLLISVSVEELQSRQGKKSRELFRENVVDDDTEQVWDLLSSIQSSDKSQEIHIVLDNAGFEFMTDLVLVAYLLSANYATKVVLHGKDMPWFVSDVTAGDLESSLNTLENAEFSDPVTNDEARSLKQFGAELRRHFESGTLIYEADPFWTTQLSYAYLPEMAPRLYKRLAAAALVIFKGDLNYRKLVFDGLWPRTTTFQHALGTLGIPAGAGKPGLRILALRTCKADTCVGLQPGKEEEVDPHGTREWTRTGKYAVNSFCDAKGGPGSMSANQKTEAYTA